MRELERQEDGAGVGEIAKIALHNGRDIDSIGDSDVQVNEQVPVLVPYPHPLVRDFLVGKVNVFVDEMKTE